MIKALVIAVALWWLAKFLVSAQKLFSNALKLARIEEMAQQCEPLKYSDRYKTTIPLLMGMAEENAVGTVHIEREGREVRIGLEIKWWGKLIPGNKQRIAIRARELMNEGGLKCNCEVCKQRKATA